MPSWASGIDLNQRVNPLPPNPCRQPVAADIAKLPELLRK
jgi:hypothetical protein